MSVSLLSGQRSLVEGRVEEKKTYEIAQTEIWSKNSTKPSYLLVQAEWQNC